MVMWNISREVLSENTSNFIFFTDLRSRNEANAFFVKMTGLIFMQTLIVSQSYGSKGSWNVMIQNKC